MAGPWRASLERGLSSGFWESWLFRLALDPWGFELGCLPEVMDGRCQPHGRGFYARYFDHSNWQTARGSEEFPPFRSSHGMAGEARAPYAQRVD